MYGIFGGMLRSAGCNRSIGLFLCIKGENKYDLPYETMFAYYKQNDLFAVTAILVYCMRDVTITHKVANVDVLLNKLVNMSNLMIVDILALIANQDLHAKDIANHAVFSGRTPSSEYSAPLTTPPSQLLKCRYVISIMKYSV